MRRNSSAPLRSSPARPSRLALAVLAPLAIPAIAAAQETGTVTGTVTRAAEGGELSSVSVAIPAIGLSTITGTDGKYTLRRVPAGPQTIVFRWLGYRPTEVQVVVEPGSTVTADAALEAVVISLGEIVVEGASRGPGADRGGAGRDLGGAAGSAPERRDHRPGADGAPERAGRGRRAERRQRLQRQRPRLQLLAQPPGAHAPGRPRPRHRLPRLAGVERADPAARRPGQGGDGPRPGLARSTAPTPSAASSTSPPPRRARCWATSSPSPAASWRRSGWTAGTPASLADGRIGFRLNGGYNRSDTYSRSRTLRNGTSLQQEYDGGHRRAGAAHRGGAAAQRPDRRPGDRRGQRRPRPAPEHLRQRPARLLPRQRLGALGGRRRRAGWRTRSS